MKGKEGGDPKRIFFLKKKYYSQMSQTQLMGQQ